AELQGFSYAYKELDLRGNWPEKVELRLGKAKKIKGKVVNLDNEPVPDIPVEITLPHGNIWSMPPADAIHLCKYNTVVITDKEGQFVACDQPTEFLCLTIEEDPVHGYAQDIRYIPAPDYFDQYIVLRGICSIYGTVTDNNGKLLERASVYNTMFNGNNSEQNGLPVFTDEKGEFRFENIKEGKSYISVIHDEYGNALKAVLIKQGEEKQCDIELPDGLSIDVIVCGEDKQPLEGVEVQVIDTETGTYLFFGETDVHGTCKIHSLNKGNKIEIIANYSLTYPGYMSYTRLINVNDSTEVTLSLKRFCQFKFNVYDELTREPIREFETYTITYESINSEAIYSEGPYFTHCTEGKDEAKMLDLCTIAYYFYAKGYKPHCEMIYLNEYKGIETSYDIYLKKGEHICGFVIDAATNESIVGAKVELVINSLKNQVPLLRGIPTHTTRTHEDGTFSIDSMPVNNYHINVKKEGYGALNISSDLLVVGADPKKNIIKLKQCASVYGYLTNGPDEPADSNIIRVYDGKGAFLDKVSTKPDGSYLITDLPEGRLILKSFDNANFLHYCQSAYFQKEVSLKAGENLQVDWNFQGNSFIRGICTINGKEADGIEISLIGLDSKSIIATAYTYNNGFYDIRPIPEGRYVLEAHSGVDGVGGTIRKEIAVKADDGISVDFDFGKVSLKGEIKGPDGKPIYGCWLTLTGSNNQGTFKGFTDYFGKYQFYQLPDGPYVVKVRGPEHGETSCTVSIAGDASVTKDFLLEPEAALKIQVFDSKGKGHTQATAMVTYPKDYAGYTASNERGLFVFQNLPEGKVDVVAGGGPYAPSQLSTGVAKGETVEKDLQLTEGGTLIVQARDLDGKPVPEAKISFSWPGLCGLTWSALEERGLLQIDPPSFRTDSTGAFRIGPLPAGTYPITVTAGGSSWNGEAQIRSCKAMEIKATL
ncbi:MAG: carboxypeptidase regulatory-like domain-containing protein, partial [Planctomycetes bacterium]|nr:carboxypeptidase regulatory-like domain-containing protein [Planctomycetota bacterium]